MQAIILPWVIELSCRVYASEELLDLVETIDPRADCGNSGEMSSVTSRKASLDYVKPIPIVLSLSQYALPRKKA